MNSSMFFLHHGFVFEALPQLLYLASSPFVLVSYFLAW